MNSLSDEPEPAPEPPQKPAIRVLQTGFLVAGSALLGGLAVVLWHRKSLAKLRQPSLIPESSPVEEDAGEE
jgi:hypothetical protein